MSLPRQEKPPFTSIEGQPVAFNFRLGTPETSQDLVTRTGQRLYVANISPSDEKLAPIAGWDKLPRTHDELQLGRSSLTLPETMRPASAVLGAMAAFQTEKDEVLSFIGRYTTAVQQEYKKVDIGVSLSTIGVSRGNETMIALPPHHLTDDPEMIGVWADVLQQDMESILSGDQRREELVGNFIASLGIVGRT